MNRKSLDHVTGMLVSNLLREQGITTQNIANYTDAELVEILSRPDKSRFWQTGGFRILTWESLLNLAEEVASAAGGSSIEPQVRAIGSIILCYTALEERVNSFIQDCLIAKDLSEEEITQILRKKKLVAKLDDFLKEVTGHSLKVDHPNAWKAFCVAEKIRHSKVHNKLISTTFSKDSAGTPREPKYTEIASGFLSLAREIDEYLGSIYPPEFLEMEDELQRLWITVKQRLAIKV